MTSLENHFLIGDIMVRLSGQLLQHALGYVMGRERLSLVLADMAIDGEPGLTPHVAEELAGVAILNNNCPIRTRKNLGDSLCVERNDPFDR